MRLPVDRKGVAAYGAAGLCLASAYFLGSRPEQETSLNFLSVGQGDCSVVISDGQTMLVDTGPASPYEDAGRTIVVPWLRSHGVNSIYAILLSHPDEDHVGGTPSILSAFPGARLVISDQFRNDPAMLGHLSKWHVQAEEVNWLPHYSSFKIGDLSVFVDCPFRPEGAGTNDGSMFVKLSQGEGSVTFTGDAPKEVEKGRESEADWRSEILHIGHHGSRTATDQTWLDTVKPQFAIISVGRANRYGFPTSEVLDRLGNAHIPVLRTDQEGTIRFVFDGKRFVRDQ